MSKASDAYELEDEDGEKRYAFLSVRNTKEGGQAADAYEKGTVWRVLSWWLPLDYRRVIMGIA